MVLVVSTPLKKYESHLGLLFPIYGKIKNDPNHQPTCVYIYSIYIYIILYILWSCSGSIWLCLNR